MRTNTDHRLVLTTAGSEDQAQRIASALVGQRLAACVNVVRGVSSVYRWKGEVARDDEWLLLIKTTEPLLGRVREVIRQIHTYELPELLVLTVSAGDADYLEWISESVDS